MLIARIVIGVVLAAAALYAPFYFQPSMNRVLSQAIYLAIAAMGLNLLTGFNGQVSIGHGAFFGVGRLHLRHPGGRPRLDLRAHHPRGRAAQRARSACSSACRRCGCAGLYLALVTLGLAVLFPRIAQKFVEGTGGVALLRPPRREFESLIAGLDDDQWAYFLSLAIMVVLFVLAWNLVRGRIGRAMIACATRRSPPPPWA